MNTDIVHGTMGVSVYKCGRIRECNLCTCVNRNSARAILKADDRGIELNRPCMCVYI